MFQVTLDWKGSMGKKKKEHIVFDQMLKVKKHIPISQVNRNLKYSPDVAGAAKKISKNPKRLQQGVKEQLIQ